MRSRGDKKMDCMGRCEFAGVCVCVGVRAEWRRERTKRLEGDKEGQKQGSSREKAKKKKRKKKEKVKRYGVGVCASRL